MHFDKYRSRAWILIALVAGVTWCAVGAAQEGHWERHDHVTISGSPPTSVTAGQSYSFTPTATDSQGRALVFAVSNMPTWATFNTTTGQLSGTPSAASVGNYANIAIAVSDGWHTAALPSFTVQVLASTASGSAPPPTISGVAPTTDIAGSPYSFQPSASGPSGSTLAFSVQNKPAWASFSIASGLLDGTPTSAQTGVYSNIVLSVSDGTSSSSLPAFSITVTAATPTTGNATLNWLPPSQNSDGSALTDLAGIVIYYGTSSSNLSQSVQVGSPTQTSYTISNLPSGTWYFGAVAYTTTGLQSAMSSLVSAAIP